MRSIIFCLCGVATFGLAHGQSLVIHNVAIVSPERAQLLANADVVIEAGRIVSVGPHSSRAHVDSAEILDGSGLYLSPGLIDSHVHLNQIPGMTAEHEAAHPEIARVARAQFPKSYLYYGFTTLVDLNSTPQAMARWNAQPLRPDTYFCGAAPIIDGYPMSFVPKSIRYRMPYFIVDSADQADLPPGVDRAAHTPAAVVARMKRDGAHCLKTHFERGFGGARQLPVPRVEVIRELVKEAHAAQMPVFLHANSAEAQAFGLEAGVDVMAHGIWKWAGGGTSAELPSSVTKILDGVIRSKTGWQATIQVLYGERDVFGNAFLADARLLEAVPGPLLAWYRTEKGKWFRDMLAKNAGISPEAPSQDVNRLPIDRVDRATAYLARGNARFLFGSDTPSDDTYANPHGLNGRMEMQRLVNAGLTAPQLFRSATLGNAEALGLASEIGTVENGKRANLLLLRGNPIDSVDAFDRIEKVILNGKVLERAALAANASEER